MLQPKEFDPCQQMRRPNYELQYKRDAYLQDVELHHHDFYEIYFLVSGNVTYSIESKLCPVLPGEVLLISPKELHQVYIRPEMAVYERYVLWLDPKFIPQLSTPQTDLLKALDPADPAYRNKITMSRHMQAHIQHLMESLYQESQSEAFGAELLQNSLLTQLLITINRLAADTSDNQQENSREDMVSDVIEYINANFAENLTLAGLADTFFVSKYHLSHKFSRRMGISINRYIRKKRLQNARQMLAQGEKPNAVFAQCGFHDYVSFYRAFREEYGSSPREYLQSAQ